MSHLHYLCVFAVLFTAAYGQQCREGWHYDSSHGSCYAIPPGAEGSWAEAMAYCAAMSSELAVVESAGEHNYLKNLLNTTRDSYVHDRDFWIGATDILEEGVFIWANRMTQVETYFWASGQPDNSHGRQGCVRMEHEANWNWGDGACGSTEYFICEREAEGK